MNYFLHLSLPVLLIALGALSACKDSTPAQDPDELTWLTLFNGRDLDDWTIKISGAPAGENLLNTFRVTEGILQVRYEDYEQFDNRFGHISYNGGPYSHYHLQVEYRFVGEPVPGAPAWAYRNNGIMFHAQSAAEMSLDQAFPVSMEFQFLGSDEQHQRTTGNLCTPGTHVVMKGELRTEHCINSNSDPLMGDQWVTAELIVHGGEFAQQFINGQVVMEYTDLQLDDGTPLAKGYIALQAESHPTEFRSIRLLNLEGCMDKKAKNFKNYFVKHHQQACVY